MDKEVLEELKIGVVTKFPFFIHLLNVVKIKETDYDTSFTDGFYIYLSKRQIKNFTLPQLLVVVAHELFHIVLSHVERFKQMRKKSEVDAFLWNVATDLVINEYLRMTLGYNLVTSTNAITLDTLRDTLSKEDLESKEWEILSNDILRLSSEDVYKILKRFKNSILSAPDVFVIDIIPSQAESISESEKEKIERAIRKVIIDIKKNFRGFNTDFIELEISNFLKSKIDWREILRKRMKAKLEKLRPTYHKRKSHVLSKYLNEDVVYFKYKQESKETFNVYVVVDTSASINHKTLHQFISEVYHLAVSYGSNVTLIQHDSEIKSIEKLKKKHIDKIKVTGRGGTSHKEVLKYLHSLDEKEKKRSIVVFLSDFVSDLTDYDVEMLRREFDDVILINEELKLVKRVFKF